MAVGLRQPAQTGRTACATRSRRASSILAADERRARFYVAEVAVRRASGCGTASDARHGAPQLDDRPGPRRDCRARAGRPPGSPTRSPARSGIGSISWFRPGAAPELPAEVPRFMYIAVLPYRGAAAAEGRAGRSWLVRPDSWRYRLAPWGVEALARNLSDPAAFGRFTAAATASPPTSSPTTSASACWRRSPPASPSTATTRRRSARSPAPRRSRGGPSTSTSPARRSASSPPTRRSTAMSGR